ncbi:MAG TPA: hypothetical protein VLF66_13730, partial [Thermoanaerobaculia bacterium]|nr:hypothetical protein [Thermoanaerobaculia bacterium]
MAYLYGPGVEPTGGKRRAVTWSELTLDVDGQMVWELAQDSGAHRLLLESKADRTLTYRLQVAALRPANAQDQARQLCDEQFAEAHSLEEKGQRAEAVALFGTNVEVCRQGRYTRGEGSTLLGRGGGLTQLGRLEEARQDLEASFTIFEELGETGAMGIAKVSLGNLERRLAHWDEALH